MLPGIVTDRPPKVALTSPESGHVGLILALTPLLAPIRPDLQHNKAKQFSTEDQHKTLQDTLQGVARLFGAGYTDNYLSYARVHCEGCFRKKADQNIEGSGIEGVRLRAEGAL